ncbi:MAG: glycerol-3-phosphate dehydrogenase/oxidase [Bdellovibrionales bacterium]|nr:glycerol-3-phosphate dehydrogenase/oxidase [Bdellovibrionales bacterium]
MDQTFFQSPRLARIREATTGSFDLVILGGGIHGACTAREAALQGYRVLLLEAQDFGQGTSSRSSKLLHGGIRYLENGDLRLVYEALHERERIRRQAPHLTATTPLLFPEIEGSTRPAWQLGIGMRLYDGLSRFWSPVQHSSFPRHRRVAPGEPEAQRLRSMGLRFGACFRFYDGQMDDARLVIENIVDAAECGAVTLNHARVLTVQRVPEGKVRWRVDWEDAAGRHQTRAASIANLTGSWAPSVVSTVFSEPYTHWKSHWPTPYYSRGTHLLFDHPWQGPGLVLPTERKGGVYFVLPFLTAWGAATLVGTTDVAVGANEANPEPSEAEVETLFERLEKHLPYAPLAAHKPYGQFAGMRILAGSDRSLTKTVTAISREEALLEQDYCVHLIGGKYTTARRTAEQVIAAIQRLLGHRVSSSRTRTRPLPGGDGWTDHGARGLQAALCAGDAELSAAAESFVRVFGMRANQFVTAEHPHTFRTLFERVIRYCVDVEQARDAADLLRRLSLDKAPPSATREVRDLMREVGQHTAPSPLAER